MHRGKRGVESMGSFKSLRHACKRVIITFLAALIALASVGTLVEIATTEVAAAAAPTITGPGYAEYQTSNVFTTTIAAAELDDPPEVVQLHEGIHERGLEVGQTRELFAL